MVTRFGFVAKIGRFSAPNGDEIYSRRQKKGVFDFKTVTRFGLVAKKKRFSPQNGDEIRSRRQNRAFLTSKRRRELVSSPKVGVFRLKTVTRTGLVVKK
ncbi:hypothetical protein [Caldibacillus sp. 210928-DFI.2.22]|nr:hypothetical protein [Caldibacillus sp. 210928-DFI.2.22]